MASIVKPIGVVTAYGYAKKHGFQGTEEEWATLQAQSGTNAQRAEAAANVAQDARNSANSAANSAANSELSARTSADAAARSAEQAAATHGYVFFEINDAGRLIMTKTESVETLDFQMKNGRLEAVYG